MLDLPPSPQERQTAEGKEREGGWVRDERLLVLALHYYAIRCLEERAVQQTPRNDRLERFDQSNIYLL